MDLWREAFVWLLGLVTSLSLFILNELRKKFDTMSANIETLMKERAVEREIDRRIGTDRRRDVVEFMGLDRREQPERRADGWPSKGG